MNVKLTLEDIVNIMEADLKVRMIQIETKIEDDVPEIIACDVTKFKQIVLGLIQ
jgi:signal transduction histidine kinase